MPEIRELRYEFSDHDEASAAINAYDRSKPPNVAPYPKFEIDWVDLEQHDTIVIWLKLKQE